MLSVRKILKRVVVTLIVVLAIDASVVVYFSQKSSVPQHSDAVVVLGAAIGTPALRSRATKGLELYQSGVSDVLVLSGGRVRAEDISEAGYMQKVIARAGGELPTMLLDEQSHNTYENIWNARALVPDAKSVTVVSDEFHLARAVLLARRAGFSEVYWAAPDPYYYSKTDLAFYYGREVVAILYYVPRLIFG